PVGEQAVARWGEAEGAARRLDDLVAQGFPSAELREQVRAFNDAVANEAAAARQLAVTAQDDRDFLSQLADVRTSKEDQFDKTDTDDAYRKAFLDHGVNVDAMTAEAAALRLASRPPAVCVEVAAALDDWALERRRLKRPPADWQRLVSLARAVDRDPSRTAPRSLDSTAGAPRP